MKLSVKPSGYLCNPLSIIHFLLYRLLPLASISLYSCFYLYQRFYALYNGETCLISQFTVPEFAVKIKDCSVCSNVRGSTVIDDIIPMEFMKKHAYSIVPSLMKEAASDWPAINVVTVDYFKELYNNNPTSLDYDVNGGQFFAYSSGINDIGELMKLNGDNSEHSKWYIGWSTDDPIVGAELKKHMRDPYFLPPHSSEKNLAWIFMGSPGPGASLHVDWVGRVSWQAQLSGIKTWTLVPPPECEQVCTSFNITVNTGDIVVVDTNFWYHSTYVHEGEVSITYGTEFE